MNAQTLVAVYDSTARAEAVVRDLRAANVDADAISQHAKSGSKAGSAKTTHAGEPREQGFWSSLFGGTPDNDTAMYDRSIDAGSTVVTVRVGEEQVDRVSAILEKHNPIDMDEHAAGHGAVETSTMRTTTAPAMGARGTATAAKTGDTIQLSEETLSVGKRAISGGTTRIRRYVVETPVEEKVTLHTEKVTMDRRPVTDNRAVGEGSFTDKTIEMTESSEEAVVAKTARVREEVSLRKETTERVETIKDTVRRDEVKIEQVPGVQNNTSRSTATTPVMPATPPRQPAKV